MNKVLLIGIIILIIFSLTKLFNVEHFGGNYRYDVNINNCSECRVPRKNTQLL